MIYLIFDTNIWLYLAKGRDTVNDRFYERYHFDLLDKLITLSDRKEIIVLSSEIIKAEWNRNKHAAFDQIKEIDDKIDEGVNKLRKAVKQNNEELIKEIIESNTNLRSLKKRNEEHIESVEKFIHFCQQIPIEDAVKLLVFDLAISKKAPFHNSKNNVADAAILISSSNFVQQNNSAHAIFVSNNTNEFADSKTKNKFHNDIIGYIDTQYLEYSTNLPASLNISEEILDDVREFQYEQYLNSISFECESTPCLGHEDFHPYGYFDKTGDYWYSSDFLAKTQLDLFTGETKKEPEPWQFKLGYCLYCRTLHIECPECQEIICIEQPNHVFCESCQKKFDLNEKDGQVELIFDDQPSDE